MARTKKPKMPKKVRAMGMKMGLAGMKGMSKAKSMKKKKSMY